MDNTITAHKAKLANLLGLETGDVKLQYGITNAVLYAPCSTGELRTVLDGYPEATWDDNTVFIKLDTHVKAL